MVIIVSQIIILSQRLRVCRYCIRILAYVVSIWEKIEISLVSPVSPDMA